MLDAFSRFELLVGRKAIEKLKCSKVAIFGVGGVGSFVAEGLARGGVGRFILVDDDLVCITNLNRQIHATIKTIGRPKVEVMKERILDINPDADVETYKLFYLPGTVPGFLDGDVDYIVDAVDTVAAKVDIVVKAKEKGIPIISSMGTGNKFDPTKLRIADLSETSVDPLARVMRKELRDRGITSLKVLFSYEAPAKTEDGGQKACGYECTGCEGSERKNAGRRKTPGSTSFVPPAAGLIIAGEVIMDIIGRGERDV
ncbi:MAG: tRNA threonylcarbamoyladenosine dehydratase [Acetivibrionales bacterium]|jgi:tRNA A37 threonylcarbamoyladenosine dehydratase